MGCDNKKQSSLRLIIIYSMFSEVSTSTSTFTVTDTHFRQRTKPAPIRVLNQNASLLEPRNNSKRMQHHCITFTGERTNTQSSVQF